MTTARAEICIKSKKGFQKGPFFAQNANEVFTGGRFLRIMQKQFSKSAIFWILCKWSDYFLHKMQIQQPSVAYFAKIIVKKSVT